MRPVYKDGPYFLRRGDKLAFSFKCVLIKYLILQVLNYFNLKTENFPSIFFQDKTYLLVEIIWGLRQPGQQFRTRDEKVNETCWGGGGLWNGQVGTYRGGQ